MVEGLDHELINKIADDIVETIKERLGYMRTASDWKDYELIDTSEGERLERWGKVILIRPDPQVIWNTPKKHPLWNKANARYHRSSSGGGKWEVMQKTPPQWSIKYKELTFNIKPMGFKHTGLFPEPVSYTHLDVYKRQIQ